MSPQVTLHFIRLGPFISVPAFMELVRSHAPAIEVLLASRPKHKVVSPAETDLEYLQPRYEIVLLVKRTSPFWPGEIQGSIYRDYALHISPTSSSPPSPSASSSIAAPSSAAVIKAVDPKFDAFLTRHRASANASKPVAAVHLVRFAGGSSSPSPPPSSSSSYAEELVKTSSKFGARVRAAGKVVEAPVEARGTNWNSGEDGARWDHLAVVEYPSLDAFAALLASEEYGALKEKWRAGGLRDALLWCTLEMEGEGAGDKARL